MQSNQIIDKIAGNLRLPLPGLTSHLKMMPAIRKAILSDPNAFMNPIQSSVLIALFSMGKGLGTILIKRPANNTVHGGQIGFPGGKCEESDASFIDTALREAWEETALQPEKVQVLGLLSPLYVLPSNFTINPVVGYIDRMESLTPNPAEVEYIIKLPLQQLRQYTTHLDLDVRAGIMKDVPCFSLNGHVIWGATAMILQELLDVME